MLFFSAAYQSVKEHSIQGRYITYDMISPLLKKLDSKFKVVEIGKSVNGIPIESVDFGYGETKILMWSQMHGNESTTTKAVMDLLNFLQSESDLVFEISKKCTIRVIPILNPDGAKAYTRVNANEIDLNRDAQNLSQPESKILRQAYTNFGPDFCFNLHDQRTKYNVGDTRKSATLSFLAPAFDEERTISDTRTRAMQLIHEMNLVLQEHIPGQVGRYDDGFNSNCVGDTFQMLQTPTVLFEAGHFPGDYERERTRELIYMSLVQAIKSAMQLGPITEFYDTAYFGIPENGQRFFDLVLHNAHYVDVCYDQGVSLGVNYEERLTDGAIHFIPEIKGVFGKGHYLGHVEYDCKNEKELQNLKDSPLFEMLFGHNA